MGTLRVLATAAEKTPIELRQLTETKLKVGAAYDKLDEVKAQNPNATKILANQFKGRGWHWSKSDTEFNQFDVYKARGDSFENVGVHIGTEQASVDRAAQYSGTPRDSTRKAIEGIKSEGVGARPVPGNPHAIIDKGVGHVVSVAYRDDKPLLKPNGKTYTEDEARKAIREEIRTPEFFQFLSERGLWRDIVASERVRLRTEMDQRIQRLRSFEAGENSTGAENERRSIASIKEDLKEANSWEDAATVSTDKLDRDFVNSVVSTLYDKYGPVVGQYLSEVKGYTHIPYINAGEDIGKVSHIVLDPYKNARRTDAAFMSEYGGLKAGVAGAAGAAGLAAQADKSENKSGTKTTVKVKLKSKSNGT